MRFTKSHKATIFVIIAFIGWYMHQWIWPYLLQSLSYHSVWAMPWPIAIILWILFAALPFVLGVYYLFNLVFEKS